MSSFQEKKQQKHDHHNRGSINIPFLKVCWQLYFLRLESGNNNLPAWYKVCELHLALNVQIWRLRRNCRLLGSNASKKSRLLSTSPKDLKVEVISKLRVIRNLAAIRRSANDLSQSILYQSQYEQGLSFPGSLYFNRGMNKWMERRQYWCSCEMKTWKNSGLPEF